MLFAEPHAGRRPMLTEVTCFQAAIGPAQISGGCCQSERNAATILPSRDAAKLPNTPRCSPSSPCHSRSSLPLATSSVPIALDPPTYSTTCICAGDSHEHVVGDAARPGVRLTAAPPAPGTVNTSPPPTPSPLISPPMKPIDAPSGDHRGSAICSAGLWIAATAPVSLGIV